MNYIALINEFWAKDLEHSFTPNDIAVYFRLLERCNALGWKNPFNFSVDELLVKLRLKTKDPLDTARNRLKQAGLIDFRNGQGRGHVTTYWLASSELVAEKKLSEKGQKNTPFMPPFSPSFSSPFSPPTYPLVHKTKPNKTKEEATASALAPDHDFQEWQHWAEEHAAQVLRMKTPLKAEDLRKLTADFGKPLLLEVFEAMHNHVPLLKKYSSANLTARDWCKRRAADPRLSSAGRNGTTAALPPKNVNKTLSQQHGPRI